MKNLRITTLLLALCCTPVVAGGATLCGRPTGLGYITVNSTPYGCIKGGTYSTVRSDYAEINANYDYVCITYTSDISPSNELALGHHYVSYCSAQSSTYACNKENKYSSSGCTTCTGGYASKSDNHKTTSCNYCKPNYYWNGSGCTACASGTVTSGSDFHKETSCSASGCSANQYFNGSICVTCPTGSYASDTPTPHSNTSCDYCNLGYYYKEGSGCIMCPYNTVAPIAPAFGGYKRPIEECCLTEDATFSDETGTFTINSYDTTTRPGAFSKCCYDGE